jgi:hypothetical protein
MFDVRARDATCGFDGFGPAEKRSDATTTGMPRATRTRRDALGRRGSGAASARKATRAGRKEEGESERGARASAASERRRMRQDDETGRRTVVPRSGRRETIISGRGRKRRRA